jgi:uncharacterized protein with PIN domain
MAKGSFLGRGKRFWPEGESWMMKFLVDAMLGKLGKELRMLGYDTLYYRGKDLHELIQLARQQERVILTRNTRLTPETTENPMIRVTEDDPVLQLKQLLRQGIIAFNGKSLFSRCLLCNSRLDEITREEAEGKVPDYIYRHHKEFYRCPQCRRLYWPGTHQERMKKRLEEFI